MNKLHLSISSLLCACAFSLIAPSAAFSDAMINPTYDWIVEIETQQIENRYDFQGTGQKSVVKAHVNYHSSKTPLSQTEYEDLWYASGKPIGLRRNHTLAITPGEQVAIRVKHKTSNASSNEKIAAANASLRVMLDAMLNGNMVTAVLVPQTSFSAITQSLQAQNCTPAAMGEANVMSNADIFVKAEPDGPSQMLHYLK